MARGPSSTAFKILRLIFLVLLVISIAVFILGIVLVLSKFRQLNQWKDDTKWTDGSREEQQSQTKEQTAIVYALRLSSALSASIVLVGLLNLIFGFYGIITLRMGSLLLFGLFSTICLILSIAQLYYDDEPNVSIAWLVLEIFEIIVLVMIIRELRTDEGKEIRRRVEERQSPEE